MFDDEVKRSIVASKSRLTNGEVNAERINRWNDEVARQIAIQLAYGNTEFANFLRSQLI